MKVKIDDYAHNRSLVRNLLRVKGTENYQLIASEFAVSSGCPVFIVYYYIAEEIGFNDWIIERMQKLAKFYSYTSIESKKDQGFSVEFDKNKLLAYNKEEKAEIKPKKVRRKKDE